MTDAALCGANARTGQTCRLPAGAGTTHPGFGSCKYHGGATPNGQVYAARLEAAARAAELGAEAPLAPDEALRWAVELIGGEAAWLQQKVRELEEGEQLQGVSRLQFARALSNAAERLAKVSKLAVDAGIDERRLALDALLLDRIDGAIRAAIADAGLGAEDADRLKAALGSRFRELAEADVRQLKP
jgi:hypothetical protein